MEMEMNNNNILGFVVWEEEFLLCIYTILFMKLTGPTTNKQPTN